jgi:hypothetical protein
MMIVFILNATMSPQERTGKPHPRALLIWTILNIAALVALGYLLRAQTLALASFALATFHLLVIVAALLVISEENDVWNGFVRYDRTRQGRSGGKSVDCRRFTRGRIVKSAWLMVISAGLYLLFLAVAVRGVHSQSPILNQPYQPSLSIWRYLATVAVQIPFIESLAQWGSKSTSLLRAMEFKGFAGRTIEAFITITNASIIVGTINAYLKQKSRIRRLVSEIDSDQVDAVFLQQQAARAPSEIKSEIIDMAVAHPEARVRYRAMEIAGRLNTITFPLTLIHNLNRETAERNRCRGLEVSLEIVRNNGNRFEPTFRWLLQKKIRSQLDNHRAHYSREVLKLLGELNSALQAPTNSRVLGRR